MDQTTNEEILNDNSKLELKVLRALTRLRKNTAQSKKKEGTSLTQIVKYLKANYRDLDGDIVTQVITALAQCIKNGLVCALDNGRYLHLGPKSRTMISTCFARTLHGAGCGCAKKVPCSRACCIINLDVRKQDSTTKRKCYKRKANTESPGAENKVDICEASLCDSCSEIHAVPNQYSNKRIRMSIRKQFTAPFDTFSPRDEID